ncbi:hypothetical protein R3P38DRAFT_1590373 [Favolaschia claudopus]|uniref:Uncharacterized protein n=1 Tax=Favolaschia claudopus TaxID=2862362 RepID=A0AAW0AHN0_9AGAR
MGLTSCRLSLPYILFSLFFLTVTAIFVYLFLDSQLPRSYSYPFLYTTHYDTKTGILRILLYILLFDLTIFFSPGSSCALARLYSRALYEQDFVNSRWIIALFSVVFARNDFHPAGTLSKAHATISLPLPNPHCGPLLRTSFASPRPRLLVDGRLPKLPVFETSRVRLRPDVVQMHVNPVVAFFGCVILARAITEPPTHLPHSRR